MARNFVSDGDHIDIIAPAGGCKAGIVYKFGSLIGVALNNAQANERVGLTVRGVFEFPKATGAIGLGADVRWSTADNNANVAAESATNFTIGAAVEAADAAKSSVKVLLYAGRT